jgi:hypothetical protein
MNIRKMNIKVKFHFALIFSFLALLSSYNCLFAQLSPGDLHKSHANLEGIENCTKCHDVGKQVAPSKCLSCHVILREHINNNKGLHANPEYRQCEKCHVEHHGRDFDLIYWKNGQKNFDHKKTGYMLEGKHAELDCRSCHKPVNISNQNLFEERKKNLKTTFLGLNTECLSCHHDEHRGQVGKDCLNCHTMKGWTPPENFDHSKTDFRLTGKHLQVACQKCHQSIVDNRFPTDKSYLKFKLTRFSQCVNCHRDPHTNKFGQVCTTCHNTVGWYRVNRANFDHNRTNFPLKGRHQFVQCEKCHSPGKPLKGLKYSRCMGCHSDFHQGQFVKRSSGSDCGECHTVDGFVPSTFTIAQHQNTDFILQGAHLAIPCIACHKQTVGSYGKKTIQFIFTFKDCQNCHNDPHGGDADKFIKKGGCVYCHNTESWKTITFDHKQTGFALMGRHADITCGSCHKSVDRTSIAVRLKLAGLSTVCQDCHKDIHRGQFSNLINQAGSIKRITDCGRCHIPRNWSAENFDHNRDANFKLEGAHKLVPCSECHIPTEENGIKFVKYKPINPACNTCHGEKVLPELR